MSEVHHLKTYRNIRSITKQLKTIESVVICLVNAINELTKFEKYSNIRIQRDALYRILVDVKLDRDKKQDTLQRLKHEKMD